MNFGDRDHAVFVGDLACDVTGDKLLEFFSDSYPSTCSAKVITDPTTNRPRGFGFVHFTSEADRDRAIAEMHGVLLSSRVIRVSEANGSKGKMPATGGYKGMSGYGGSTRTSDGASSANQGAHPADYDPTNTTLFVGGLSSCVTEAQLRDIFAKFGDIIYTKVPQGKGCGFVQFVDRWAAQVAFMQMNGAVIGNSAIRISWGRSSSKLTAALASGQMPASAPMMGFRMGEPQGPHQGAVMPSWPYGSMAAAYPTQAPGMPWPFQPNAPPPYDPYFQYYYYCSSMAAAQKGQQTGGQGVAPHQIEARGNPSEQQHHSPGWRPSQPVTPWNANYKSSRVRYSGSTSGGGAPASFSTASTGGARASPEVEVTEH